MEHKRVLIGEAIMLHSLVELPRMCNKCFAYLGVIYITHLMVEAKLHDELRMIQRCFDDNKGDDKKLKGQSKNEFKKFKIEPRKNEFKIESRTLQDSRIKLPRIKIKIQDSRFKNQEKT